MQHCCSSPSGASFVSRSAPVRACYVFRHIHSSGAYFELIKPGPGNRWQRAADPVPWCTFKQLQAPAGGGQSTRYRLALWEKTSNSCTRRAWCSSRSSLISRSAVMLTPCKPGRQGQDSLGAGVGKVICSHVQHTEAASQLSCALDCGALELLDTQPQSLIKPPRDHTNCQYSRQDWHWLIH